MEPVDSRDRAVGGYGKAILSSSLYRLLGRRAVFAHAGSSDSPPSCGEQPDGGTEKQAGANDHDGAGGDAAQHSGGNGGGCDVRGFPCGQFALALSLGIAIQNFPEGAIISMPLRAEGESKGRAFWGGVLSGVVEPIGAVLTILAAQLVIPALPYFLSFAAGAMLYVVVEELIPEMSQGRHSNIGTVFFALGFSVMMVLDVALG